MDSQTTYEERMRCLESLEKQQAEWSTERETLLRENEELKLQVNMLEQKYTECYIEKEILSVEKMEFLALFESIDAMIYAIDPETNDILYTNKHTRKALQNRNLVGQKCYRVLQGKDSPCDFCNHSQLFGNNLGKTYIFENQNKLTGKWYHCIAKAISWPGTEKMVRWEMAICIHEQKMATEAFIESESKYSTLVKNAKDGITIIQDGVRQYCNQAMAKMLGYKEEEIVGRYYLDIVAEEHRARFKDLTKLEKGTAGKAKLYESIMISKTGERLEVEISFTKIIYKNKPAHMELVRNVSTRKKMEELLRQSEQRYEILLDYLNSYIPLHIGASDEDYIFIFWNKYSEKMLGYTAEETEGKMSPIKIHETDEDVNEVLRITGAGDIYDREINFVHKNGSLVPVHCVVVPRQDADGKLVGLYGFAEDITNRKKAEIALKESEKQFRSLAENSPICICIVQDGQIVYENPEHKKVFNFAPKKTSFTSFLKRIHPEDLRQIRQQFKKKFDVSKPVLDLKFRFFMESPKTRSGLKWFRSRTSRIKYKGHEAILINTLDMTEEHKIKQLLNMEDKMTSLGRVAAGIAHEIRSPLMATMLFLNNLDLICRENELIEGDLLDDVKVIIADILDATLNIETVIKRVIDFSKPNVISKSPTTINQAIEEAIKMSSSTLRKTGITLQQNLTADVLYYHLDLQRLKQVFLNLITNSIQAMQNVEGPKLLSIESQTTSNLIIYRISDSGPGILANYREKIFDPFFTTKKYGSGIGLSISHRIITDHGGTIDVSQSKWGGAEFTIYIPFLELMDS